jgi:hypothetical protein
MIPYFHTCPYCAMRGSYAYERWKRCEPWFGSSIGVACLTLSPIDIDCSAGDVAMVLPEISPGAAMVPEITPSWLLISI